MLGNIQLLRWLAAMVVVLFHASQTVAKEGGMPVWTASFGHWGEAGVDAFFVISGFVMVVSQGRHPRSILTFLMERALRILPLYWSLTLAMGAVLAFAPQLFNSEVFSASRLLGSLAMVSGVMGHDFPTIYVGWTLEFEMLFYVLFSLSFRLFPLHWTWAPVGAVFVLGGIAGLTPLFLVEFAMSMALATLWTRAKMPTMPWLGLGLAFGGVALALVLAESFGRLVVWGLPAMMLVAGLVLLPQLSGRLVLRAGAASYAIYLMQVPMLPLAFRLLAKTAPEMNGDLRVLAATAITCLAGLLCHLWFEAPLTQVLKRWTRRRSSLVDVQAAAR